MITCGGCERPLLDGYLCPACSTALVLTLDVLPHLLAELMITAYRQDRLAVPGSGRGSGERGLPFKARATRLLADVRLHLLGFTVIADRVLDGNDLRLCEALAATVADRARHDRHVGRMFVVLGEDELRIREVIDLPRTYRYLGRCDHCGTELYADRGAAVWQCAGVGCEASYEIKARMAELVERSRDVIASTSTISSALTSLEFPVTEELIRKWASRGLLTAQPSDLGRARYYRLGDVLDQLLKQRAKLAERRAR